MVRLRLRGLRGETSGHAGKVMIDTVCAPDGREDPQVFACGVCGKTITDHTAAVTLSATWMPHWIEGRPDPALQDFWLHSPCLEAMWRGQSAWEKSILYGRDDDGTPIDWDEPWEDFDGV